MSEANSKTHDLPEDEIIVKVQRMFPNCQKYKKCCEADKEFWLKYQEKVRALYKGMLEPKKPEGFEKF